MQNLWYTDGRKSVSVGRLDDFLEWLIDQDGDADGEIRTKTASQKVAFVYRCMNLIANAMRGVPWRITPVGNDDAWDESQGYQNKLGFLPDPNRIIELVARSLLAPGSAYLFKTQKGGETTDLRYMAASTLTPEFGPQGVERFVREINGKRYVYPAERFVWFWPPDESVEIGPPQSSPVKAALMAAGANYYTAKFISDFFARGAIKGTLLAVKGNPVEAERNRLKDWWRRTFGQGSKSSFNTEIINADSIEPVKIGEGLESLNNTELTKQMREDIAVAMGVPMSKLLSSSVSGLGGGGVAESDDIGFYQDTVLPLGEFVADTLNEQLLRPLGYQWSWLWDTLDVFQADEKTRSVAFKTYVDAGMKQNIAAYMLGIEIPKPDDVPEWYVDSFEEKQEPPAFGQGGDDDEGMDRQQLAEYQRERAETTGETRAVELDKWERMAAKRFEEGHPEKALEFETEIIHPGRVAVIKKGLQCCETADDVSDMFDALADAESYSKKKVGLKASREAIEARLKRKIRQAMQGWETSVAQAIEQGRPIDYDQLFKDFHAALRPEMELIQTQRVLDLAADVGIVFDPAIINTEAARWAREYSYDLVQGLTETTRDVVREAASTFVETSGMTMGNLRQLLRPAFGESRAEMIAITEVTRAYSEATNRYQAKLGEEGLEMNRIWQTNHDDLVCNICGPLNGKPEQDWPGHLSSGPPAHPRCRCWTSLSALPLKEHRENARELAAERERILEEMGQLVKFDAADLRQQLFAEMDAYPRIDEIAARKAKLNAQMDKLEAGTTEHGKLWREWLDLNSEQFALKQERDTAILERLAVDNPSHVKMIAGKDLDDRTRRYFGDGLTRFEKLVDAELMPDDAEVSVFTTAGRSRCFRDQVYMGQGAGPTSAVHELGHYLEHTNPDVLDKAIEFLKERAGDESLQRLGDNYDKDEVAWFDGFINPYMGKAYIHRGKISATEIVSMGLEFLYKDPIKLARQDPEYFDFIVSLVRGL